MNGREMAQALGVSEATVSRLASGNREPSVTLMVRVRRVLRWKVDAQADALQNGTYGQVFSDKMTKTKAPKRPGAELGPSAADEVAA
jgi:transcriptional regulator with XRE-family HTH domain